jgi:AAA15 family ATPase/GTPase
MFDLLRFNSYICIVIAKFAYKIHIKMIIEFSVTNFGSIREKQTLSFEATKDATLADYYIVEPIPKLRLLKLAMIFGPNASGKSTVLKALEFLRDLVIKPAQNNSNRISFEPFLLDSDSEDKNSTMELSFVQEGVKYRYLLEFNGQHIYSEILYHSPNGREGKFFERKTNIENQTVDIKYSGKEGDSNNRLKLEGLTLWNNTVLGSFSKGNIDFKELKTVYNWFDSYLMPMVSSKTDLMSWTTQRIDTSEKLKSYVTNLLGFADIQINRIDISKEEVELTENQIKALMESPLGDELKNKGLFDKKLKQVKTEFSHIGKDKNNKDVNILFPQHFESQGTLRYYGLGGILAIITAEPKAIAIDEFESSLHPDLAQNYILRFLVQSKKSQLLVTTHNIDFLGEQDVIRRDGVWFTQKNENGATELYSAADFDTSVIRKSSSLLNIYEAGRLGAKPNLGSIFS